jgi:maleylpyruvate isomerase
LVDGSRRGGQGWLRRIGRNGLMPRELADARRWMQQGTALLLSQADLAVGDLSQPSALPGWTRGHLVAHVAANADALSNLVHWAATGEPTPMYSSPADRAAGIEAGRRLPPHELARWVRRSAAGLEEEMTRLTGEQWEAPVVTAQGRTVPATEVPWLRSREVCVHAADLATSLRFSDLPADFLAALCDDVVIKRGAGAPGQALVLVATDTAARWELPGPGQPVTVAGPLAEVTAYLTGRPSALASMGGEPAPALPAWL